MRRRLAAVGLRITTGVYWALMLVATHLPPRDVPKTHVSDKVEHFVGYGLLTMLLAACLWRSKLRPGSYLLILIAIVWCYGAADELTQPIFDRTGDVKDWLADASAAAIVAALATAVRVRRMVGCARPR